MDKASKTVTKTNSGPASQKMNLYWSVSKVPAPKVPKSKSFVIFLRTNSTNALKAPINFSSSALSEDFVNISINNPSLSTIRAAIKSSPISLVYH